MNKVAENPILNLVNDQFHDVFGEGVLPAVQDAELTKLRSITAHLQAMAPHMKDLGDTLSTPQPTLDDRLAEVIAMSNRIAQLCHELKFTVTGDFDSELEESKGFAEEILNNFAAIRMHVANPPAPCECGKCDSCVAARSDEHFDRQRDGQLCDEA